MTPGELLTAALKAEKRGATRLFIDIPGQWEGSQHER